MAAAAAAVILALGPGCSDCGRPAVEVEKWLGAGAQRSGKVGTLRGLEVAATARDVVRQQAVIGEGSCNLGWRLDEAFLVDFELTIDVDGAGISRQWHEAGKWHRDDEGRWRIAADINYAEGAASGGQRRVDVVASDDGFYEFLAPGLPVRYARRGDVASWWRHEYAGRFVALMALGTDQARDQGPCGPVVVADEIGHWRPLLRAHGQVQGFDVTGFEESTAGQQRPCRQVRLTMELRDGGQMEVALRECLAASPESVALPPIERILDGDRDRSRATAMAQLKQWIEAGWVDEISPGPEQE